MSPCGACGGANKASGFAQTWQVQIDGKVEYTATTQTEARMWIIRNANGRTATMRAVAKK